MDHDEKYVLHQLKGLLSQHRQFYRNRLVGNWDQQANQHRELSLSFLEGEARAYHEALQRTGCALSVVKDLLGESSDAKD